MSHTDWDWEEGGASEHVAEEFDASEHVDVEQDEDDRHPGHEVDDVVSVADSRPRRLTLNCTDLSGRVIPITVNDTDTLGECIRQLTFRECAGRCLDDDGSIKARIRLVTVSGQLVECCRSPLHYGLQDDDSLSIIYESERDAPL